jgi:hypothetical protein
MFSQYCYIIADGMAALYGLDWYKNRRTQNRRLTKKSLVEGGYATTKEE